MRILAFDPGEDTGVAILDAAGNLEVGMTIGALGWTERLLRHITAIAKPDVVLVEELPTFAHNELASGAYQDIVHWYTVAGFPLEKVSPGQWKGMIERVRLSSTHEADAFAMARWYLRKEGAGKRDVQG